MTHSCCTPCSELQQPCTSLVHIASSMLQRCPDDQGIPLLWESLCRQGYKYLLSLEVIPAANHLLCPWLSLFRVKTKISGTGFRGTGRFQRVGKEDMSQTPLNFQGDGYPSLVLSTLHSSPYLAPDKCKPGKHIHRTSSQCTVDLESHHQLLLQLHSLTRVWKPCLLRHPFKVNALSDMQKPKQGVSGGLARMGPFLRASRDHPQFSPKVKTK